MSAQHADHGGLSRAHLRLVRLLDDLNSTVESVHDLTSKGQHESALHLVESQRSELSAVIDRIAADVAAQRRTGWRRVRRHAALAAAAVLALSGLAVSVGLGRDPAPPARSVDTSGQPPAPSVVSPDLTTPVRFLTSGDAAAAPLLLRPPNGSGPAGSPLDPSLPTDDGSGNAGLVQQAETAAKDLQYGRTPGAPQSTGERPLGILDGTVRTEPGWGTAD